MRAGVYSHGEGAYGVVRIAWGREEIHGLEWRSAIDRPGEYFLNCSDVIICAGQLCVGWSNEVKFGQNGSSWLGGRGRLGRGDQLT